MDEDVKTGIIVIMFGMAGIVTAGIEQSLYTRGILIDEYITGTIAIADLMTITILLWILFGIVIAVLKR